MKNPEPDLLSLDLEQQVGQLLMIGFHGTSVNDRLVRMVTERHVGSLIVFFRNIDDGEQATRLNGELQALASHPLLIAADQEGGSVLRVRRGATLLPSAMGLGRLGPDAVRDAGRIGGREMRAMGINLNLAPVLDINDPDNPGIGMRAFGEDAARVAACGVAAMEGLHEGGVLATAKHFPGKGRARLDAHLDLPVIDLDVGELQDRELVPFRAIIAAGVPAVMTSHCVYPALDDRPATLSRRILTGLLREELGFEGVLITDDMEMGAITGRHRGPGAAVEAFLAGADLLLICADETLQEEVIDALVAGLGDGSLPRSRLEESLRRIQRVKSMIAPAAGDIARLVEEHRPHVDRLLHEMLSIERDPAGLIPLKPARSCVVYWPDLGALTKVEEGSVSRQRLEEALAARFDSVTVEPFDPRSGTGPASRRPAEGTDLVLAFSANAHLYPEQAALLREIASGPVPVLHVVLRNPYDRDLLPGATCVLTYGFLENAIQVLVDRLCGSRMA